MKIMTFNFKAVWHKSITNQALDALSHNPIDVPGQQKLLAEVMRVITRNYQQLRLQLSIRMDWTVFDYIQELKYFCTSLNLDLSTHYECTYIRTYIFMHVAMYIFT